MRHTHLAFSFEPDVSGGAARDTLALVAAMDMEPLVESMKRSFNQVPREHASNAERLPGFCFSKHAIVISITLQWGLFIRIWIQQRES